MKKLDLIWQTGSWQRSERHFHYACEIVRNGMIGKIKRVEVLEGIKEGDRVVTSANFLLDADSKLASAVSMQEMMGRIGMADWQMRGAYEKKMEDMK